MQVSDAWDNYGITQCLKTEPHKAAAQCKDILAGWLRLHCICTQLFQVPAYRFTSSHNGCQSSALTVHRCTVHCTQSPPLVRVELLDPACRLLQVPNTCSRQLDCALPPPLLTSMAAAVLLHQRHHPVRPTAELQ